MNEELEKLVITSELYGKLSFIDELMSILTKARREVLIKINLLGDQKTSYINVEKEE